MKIKSSEINSSETPNWSELTHKPELHSWDGEMNLEKRGKEDREGSTDCWETGFLAFYIGNCSSLQSQCRWPMLCGRGTLSFKAFRCVGSTQEHMLKVRVWTGKPQHSQQYTPVVCGAHSDSGLSTSLDSGLTSSYTYYASILSYLRPFLVWKRSLVYSTQSTVTGQYPDWGKSCQAHWSQCILSLRPLFLHEAP